MNYNKIHSDINRADIYISDLARFVGNKYTSFMDRFHKEKLYASEVEKIANYFGRPVSYYFDQEEKEAVHYKNEEQLSRAEEPLDHQSIDCDPKQRKIEELTNKYFLLKSQMEKLNKKYVRLLEKHQDLPDEPIKP